MSKNLRQEMRARIFRAFRENMDKHADRKQGKSDGKIYSYGRRDALLDTSNDFCAFAKSQGAKHLQDISSDMVKKFLESKADSVTQTTLDEYRSRLRKIGDLCNIDLNVPKVIAKRRRSPQRGAESVISEEDLQKLIEYAKTHSSASGAFLRLEAQIGVRAADMAYGVVIDRTNGQLHIRSKNGKICNRQITPEVEEIIDSDDFKKLLVHERFGQTKLKAVKDGTLNTYLRRVEDKLGLERHSWHDIRRRIAQDKYDEYRLNGMSRTQALSAVSVWLNHGEKRESMVLKSYIANDW